MGVSELIARIKGIFAKEPEPPETIQFSSLNEWMASRISSKEDFLRGQILGISSRIKSESEAARQNIALLQNAELRNPNIPEKAKHFMEGNREFYIKKAMSLLDSIAAPHDIENAKAFAAQFESLANDFGASTARAYAILKEFFEEEASKIASNVKAIDSLASEIKSSIAQAGLSGIDEIRHCIERLKSRMERKELLIAEIQKKENLASSLSSEMKKLYDYINAIESSSDFSSLQALRKKLADAKGASAAKEAEISGIFAPLERPLRKYQRISFNDQDIIRRYIESPVEALSQDLGFRILGVLGNMKKAVLDSTIELKDKQKIKAIEEIRQIDRDLLSRLVSSYAQLRKRENELSVELGRLKIDEKLAKAKEQLQVRSVMHDKAKKDIEALHVELGRVDLKSAKDELSEMVSSAFGSNVLIS